jgi:hypothetical protein
VCSHGEVFIGSDAVRSGKLTGHQLRTRYRPEFPNVYVDKYIEPPIDDRAYAAWLWSKRRAVVAGVAAAALHGSQWIESDHPVELIWRNTEPPHGLIVRNERVHDDETTRIDCMSATTVPRTAFDLGRHLPRGEALARLDALMRASPFSAEDVALLMKRYRRARGFRQLRELLPLVDGGAASPRETWLRLLYIDAGLPRPTTQIPIIEGRGKLVRMADLGWEDFMVVSEYDGEHHQTNRGQYTKDMRSLRKARALGWIVDQVIKEDRPAEIVERARMALISRGWKP